MMKFCVATAFIIAATAMVSLGQSAPVGQQVKSTTEKRRSFDQFDLPNGVSLPKQPDVTEKAVQPASEIVDRETYDGVMKMIEYAARVEKEYRATSRLEHDPREYYSADNVLKRKSRALFNIIELYRTGLFGNRLTSKENLQLLKENQQVIVDIHSVYDLVPSDKTLYMARLAVLAEPYLPKPAGASGKAVEKQEVLSAMLTRMNENFERLKASVVLAN